MPLVQALKFCPMNRLLLLLTLHAAFTVLCAQTPDCAGIADGTALVDECGDCHQAYIYNFITHAVTFVDNANEAEAGPNEIIVLPDDPLNPYWNAGCTEVNGCTDPSACNFNYLATTDDGTCGIVDDCSECQIPYCYNPVTHEVSYSSEVDCDQVWIGPEMLPSPMNPYWNGSCTDCAGVVNGSALVDDCGDCHQAYIYNFITHAVAFIDNAEDAQTGPNEIVVLPDDPSNPFWGASCAEILGCTDSTACNFNYLATIDDGTCGILDDCGECQIPYCYNPISHEITYTTVDDCSQVWIGVSMLSSPMNPNWNSTCDIPGCIYEAACNYNPVANIDDESCEFSSCEVPGCTYELAVNFNPVATIDDHSCEFVSNACPSDLNADGVTGVSDLLMFLAEFGFTCGQ